MKETKSFELPESFGQVVDFKIAGIVETVYDQETRTVTFNTADVKYLNCGVKIATFENENGKKYCYLTLADYVITQENAEYVIQTCYNNYLVVAENLDMTGLEVSPVWISENHEFNGTLDGKGHTVSNLTLSTGSWAGFANNIFAGTIKNVAFVNFDNNPWGGANGIIAGRVNGGKLENVYISGNSRSCNF
jgi:hypothetical protein